MAAIDFPDSPSVNDTFVTSDGLSWRWDGSVWLRVSDLGLAVLPIGGTTSQILQKQSSTNYDVAWVDSPPPEDPIPIVLALS